MKVTSWGPVGHHDVLRSAAPTAPMRIFWPTQWFSGVMFIYRIPPARHVCTYAKHIPSVSSANLSKGQAPSVRRTDIACPPSSRPMNLVVPFCAPYSVELHFVRVFSDQCTSSIITDGVGWNQVNVELIGRRGAVSLRTRRVLLSRSWLSRPDESPTCGKETLDIGSECVTICSSTTSGEVAAERRTEETARLSAKCCCSKVR